MFDMSVTDRTQASRQADVLPPAGQARRAQSSSVQSRFGAAILHVASRVLARTDHSPRAPEPQKIPVLGTRVQSCPGNGRARQV